MGGGFLAMVSIKYTTFIEGQLRGLSYTIDFRDPKHALEVAHAHAVAFRMTAEPF